MVRLKDRIIALNEIHRKLNLLETMSSVDVDLLPNFTKSRVGMTREVHYDNENAKHSKEGAVLQSYVAILETKWRDVSRMIDTKEV